MRTQTRYFLISLLALFVAFLPSLTLSAPDGPLWFLLNFETAENYEVGILTGQTENSNFKWVSEAGGNDFDVQTEHKTNGSQGVAMTSGFERVYFYYDGSYPSDLPDPIYSGYICADMAVYANNPYQADGTYLFLNLGGNFLVAQIIIGINGDISFQEFQTDHHVLVPLVEDYVPGQVYNVCFEWNDSNDANEEFRYAVDGAWTEWRGGYNFDPQVRAIGLQGQIHEAGDWVMIDNFGTENLGPENIVNFTAPENESTQTTSFYITGTWSNVDPENYNEIDIFLGREDSFTMQFLCETAITTASGNFSCLVNENNWYQQNWIAQPLLTLKSCDEYGNCTYLNDKASNDPTLHITFAGDFPTSTTPALTIEGYTFEDQWENFEGFYASTSEKWSTSTQVGLTLNATIGAITNWLYNLSSQLTILDTDKELAGQEVGLAIRKARGYTETINNLFADFPLAQIFTIYILVFLLVLIIRLIKFIRSMIK